MEVNVPDKPTIFHIPVCPFSQRVEILLSLKGLRDAFDFVVVDITKPRPDELLRKSRGSTAMPILELEDGRVMNESLVLLQYIEDRFPTPPVRPSDPWERAVAGMLVAREGAFVSAGYTLVLNQDRARRDALVQRLLSEYAWLDAFLRHHAPDRTYLFETFGWAEAVYTSMFQRFWFLDYYEGFDLPDAGFERVRRWRDACVAHPAAQQVSYEEIVKLYYDYAKGAGNGAAPPGRTVSSFSFAPHWRERPWPPRAKYEVAATDAELGLRPAS